MIVSLDSISSYSFSRLLVIYKINVKCEQRRLSFFSLNREINLFIYLSLFDIRELSSFVQTAECVGKQQTLEADSRVFSPTTLISTCLTLPLDDRQLITAVMCDGEGH